MFVRFKHSSLFRRIIGDEEKKVWRDFDRQTIMLIDLMSRSSMSSLASTADASASISSRHCLSSASQQLTFTVRFPLDVVTAMPAVKSLRSSSGQRSGSSSFNNDSSLFSFFPILSLTVLAAAPAGVKPRSFESWANSSTALLIFTDNYAKNCVFRVCKS